jgi:hypothetical protein
MDNPNSAMAKQVALTACDFEQQRTGNLPKSVTVVLSGDTVASEEIHWPLPSTATASSRNLPEEMHWVQALDQGLVDEPSLAEAFLSSQESINDNPLY